ncbi:uncharacterized protein DMAD_12854 [Drosophila madeirensis]|uniref:Single domain-containing protein n=1 Tax=Drosophila madeirensis TaxID=30013 RepID=A0AAU9FIC4_DROMD
MGFTPETEVSLNNYAHTAYPGRCVLDMEPSLVTLELGQGINLPNIPCVVLYCIGDGYGALHKCDHSKPPQSCRYGDFQKLDAAFPDCCQRKIICD